MLGGAVLEEIGLLVILSREILDSTVFFENEVMGTSNHVSIFQSIIFSVQTNSYLDESSCAAKVRFETGLISMQDNSYRFEESQFFLKIKGPSFVWRNNLFILCELRVFN